MVQRARVQAFEGLPMRCRRSETEAASATLKVFAQRFKDTVDPETVAKAAYSYQYPLHCRR
jgi:hypothetical protein